MEGREKVAHSSSNFLIMHLLDVCRPAWSFCYM